MLKRLIKNKKGQNTAEYAILISLVVASIVAMQTYAQRALNARVKDASDYMTTRQIRKTKADDTQQYEPYYQKSGYVITSTVEEIEYQFAGTNTVGMNVTDDSLRTGNTETSFDPLRNEY